MSLARIATQTVRRCATTVMAPAAVAMAAGTIRPAVALASPPAATVSIPLRRHQSTAPPAVPKQSVIPHLVGRSSSHYTRICKMTALEAGTEYTFEPNYDLSSTKPEDFGGHPACKVPLLKIGPDTIFGSSNIARAISSVSPYPDRGIIWPEDLLLAEAMNCQELIQNAMATQVTLVFGIQVCKLPKDNPFLTKAEFGMKGSLAWLEEHAPKFISSMPHPRPITFMEICLFCLLEHITFRPSVSLEPYPALRAFAAEFGKRPSAIATPYGFDKPKA